MLFCCNSLPAYQICYPGFLAFFVPSVVKPGWGLPETMKWMTQLPTQVCWPHEVQGHNLAVSNTTHYHWSRGAPQPALQIQINPYPCRSITMNPCAKFCSDHSIRILMRRISNVNQIFLLRLNMGCLLWIQSLGFLHLYYSWAECNNIGDWIVLYQRDVLY